MTSNVLNLDSDLFNEVTIKKSNDTSKAASQSAIDTERIRDLMVKIIQETSSEEGSLASRVIQQTDISQLTAQEFQCYLRELKILCKKTPVNSFLLLLKKLDAEKNLEGISQTLEFMLKNFYDTPKAAQKSLSHIFENVCQENNIHIAFAIHLFCEQNNLKLYKGIGDVKLTPLQWAAEIGNAPLLDRMLDQRFSSLEEAGSDGQTALHLAVKKGHIECAKLLLEAGANPNAADAAGNTPLHLIEYAKARVRLTDSAGSELSELLIAFRADNLLTNHLGHTPLGMQDTFHSSTALARLVGNANGIPSTQTQIYEGLDPNYPLTKEVAESLSTMPNLFPDCSRKDLIGALRPAPTVDQIRAGQLTIIYTGWEGHAIYLVFCNGYMVICNKSRTPTAQAFKINLKQIPDDLCTQLKTIKQNPSAVGRKYFYESLTETLQAEKDDFCTDLEKCSAKPQKVGNCPMTIKLALRVGAFFNLEKRKNQPSENLKTSRDFSKAFSTYFRLDVLSRYLDDKERARHFHKVDKSSTAFSTPPKKDEHLIQEALKKLQKREYFEELVKYFPNVKEAEEPTEENALLLS